WANYLGELIRELPLHYPSWRQMPPERKARVVAKIGMETSATREYPSLIHTFFLTHTVGSVFLNPEDKDFYDEMLRLQGLGSNTPMGVPYTKDEIMAIVRGGQQRGHIPCVGWVFPGQGTPEYGGGSESGGCGDDEPRDAEDGDEDEEEEDDTGVTGAGMMSQEMMRTAARMRRRRTIVRGCGNMLSRRQVARDSPELSLGKMANVVVITMSRTLGGNMTYKINDDSVNGLFFFKFSSKDKMNAPLANGPWFIRNTPLILKKWTPDAN
nr:hypothetical protein [Tanacetum cinerariifolium]